MTFGFDVRWRRRTVRELHLPSGSLIADLAAGTGDLCRDLTAVGLRPVGFDLSFGMLAAARTTAPLAQSDALRLPVADATFDGATCGFALRNLADLPTFVTELHRVVRPGGRIALLEVSAPSNAVLRWGHGVYFGEVVPRLGALLSDGAAYRYLPRSVEYLPTPPAIVAMLRDGGFADATRVALTTGISQLFVATRDPRP
jgi:demethylmenaquinone methyltransferase / 2-methoxy-6-polyprenyl-1,4-benzoquinol methylase